MADEIDGDACVDQCKGTDSLRDKLSAHATSFARAELQRRINADIGLLDLGLPTPLAEPKLTLVCGQPGAGKSIHLFQLMIAAVESGAFPLYVDLARWNDAPSIIEFIALRLTATSVDTVTEVDDARAFVDTQSNLLLFFDGLDELTGSVHASVVAALVDYLAPKSPCLTIVACESSDCEMLTSQMPNTDFIAYSLAKLTKQQLIEILSRLEHIDSSWSATDFPSTDEDHVVTALSSPLHLSLFADCHIRRDELRNLRDVDTVESEIVEHYLNATTSHRRHYRTRLSWMAAFASRRVKGPLMTCSSEINTFDATDLTPRHLPNAARRLVVTAALLGALAVATAFGNSLIYASVATWMAIAAFEVTGRSFPSNRDLAHSVVAGIDTVHPENWRRREIVLNAVLLVVITIFAWLVPLAVVHVLLLHRRALPLSLLSGVGFGISGSVVLLLILVLPSLSSTHHPADIRLNGALQTSRRISQAAFWAVLTCTTVTMLTYLHYLRPLLTRQQNAFLSTPSTISISFGLGWFAAVITWALAGGSHVLLQSQSRLQLMRRGLLSTSPEVDFGDDQSGLVMPQARGFRFRHAVLLHRLAAETADEMFKPTWYSDQRRMSRSIRAFLAAVLCVVFVVHLNDIRIRTFDHYSITVYGGDMRPAIEAKTRIRVNVVHKATHLQRLQAVYYRRSDQDRTLGVSRILGLPGERIVMANDMVTVEGGVSVQSSQYPRPDRVFSLAVDEYFLLNDSGTPGDSRDYGAIKRSSIKGTINR